jgi:outer membrane protein assembly factor BamB
MPDWTRFRGPNGSGVSTATGVPTEFGPDRNLPWRLELPTGYYPLLDRGSGHERTRKHADDWEEVCHHQSSEGWNAETHPQRISGAGARF